MSTYASILAGSLKNSLLMDDWIKKMWHMDSVEYYSVMRKDEVTAICDNLDGS